MFKILLLVVVWDLHTRWNMLGFGWIGSRRGLGCDGWIYVDLDGPLDGEVMKDRVLTFAFLDSP